MSTFTDFDNRGKFRAWCVERAGDMVGMGANGHLCPLTQYARHLGIEATKVCDYSLFYADERSGVERVDPLVPWQDRFADRVDSECAERFRHNPVGAYRVTGALAVAILDKIPE